MLEAKKSVFNHVVYDSDIEAEFAKSFEASDDGKVIIRKIDCRVSLAGSLKNQITRQATDQEIDDAIKHGWANRGSD